jgi:hypothetical protein
MEQAGQQPQPTRLAEQGEYPSALDRCFGGIPLPRYRDLPGSRQPDAVVVDDRLAHVPPHTTSA